MDPYYRNRTWHRQPESHCRSYSPSHMKPEVFQIPVEYVRSARVERFDAVLKIQRVFRGFLVRKPVRKIRDVKKQVDAVDQKLSSREFVELIRKDEKERLRMNEGLMALLLKLDSVRCFGLGVRDCRKVVTRKVIALQEKIDSIVAAVGGDGVRVCMGTGCSDSSVVGMLVGSDKDAKCGGNGVEERLVETEVKSGEADSAKVNLDDWTEVEIVEKEVEKQGCDDGSKKNEELMEQIVEENKKMMSMMVRLVDSNEKQVEVLKALASRVEMLEKSFVCDVCDHRRCKKLKMNAASSGEDI